MQLLSIPESADHVTSDPGAFAGGHVTYERALTDDVDEVVAPGAVEVDRSGSFPRSQIDALGRQGCWR